MLYIAATPIGNRADITLRALDVFKQADFILAEDTRKTGLFLKHYQIHTRIVSFYEHNAAARIPGVIKELKQGREIVLVSSAGTPAISDPGYKLIRECRRQGLALTSLPGPSSVINALTLTAFPRDRFGFLGYLPRKTTARRKLLAEAKTWEVTLICFESPFRLLSCLKDLAAVFGPEHRIALAREMTKKFEEVLECNLQEALRHFAQTKPRGEFTLVLSRETK